jgi:hypothetical protein
VQQSYKARNKAEDNTRCRGNHVASEKGGTKNLEVGKFTKFQKFSMYVFIKFLITLFNFFICELENVKGKNLLVQSSNKGRYQTS